MKRALILAAIILAMAIPATYANNPATPQSSEAKASAVLKVTNDNFAALASKHQLLVIDFWAPWCGPCRAITPIIEELAKEYKGKVAIGKCNVDENRSLTGRFGVSGIPAIYLIKNGKVVDEQIGYCQKEVLEEKIKKLMK